MRAALALARADVPAAILEGLRLGRMVALQKPNGRVRGLVMGDVLRRLVGRTLVQQMAQHFQDACSPFQYALSTRAGTECLARILRAATEADHEATVLSVDGVGAFDHVSRASMFSQLASHERLAPLLPYVRQFYGQASQYLWYDDNGAAHVVEQGEGGEQGDPLMPGLFALAQHPALQATQAMLLPGEVLFAFFDDIYPLAARPCACHFRHVAGASASACRHPG